MADGSAPLRGRSALITGGGSGIGLACAERLLRDGAAVTICGRTEERLRAATDALRAQAPTDAVVQWIAADVSDEEQVERAVELARQPNDGLHLVVASAGSGWPGPVIATTLEAFRSVLDVNVVGTFLTFKHAGAALVQSGGGSMVAISSLAGVRTHRSLGVYAVSKAAVDMLVRSLADELGRAGIRVNSVRPGLVDTELVAAPMQVEGLVDDYLRQMPVSRVGQVDDVAALVGFLLGPESTWITGEAISVDGGHHLRGGPDYEPVARAFFGDDAVDAVFEP